MHRSERLLSHAAPELCGEWNENRNAPLTPETVTVCSTASVYWTCQYGHVWKARIIDRYHGEGCAWCQGRRKYRPHFA